MPITDDLISFWELDEASGTRNDAHGTNHLADNNTVLSGAGKVDTAADFEQDNAEFLSIASNASLQMGDIDFTICAWVNLESKTHPTTDDLNIIAKRGGAGSLQYYLRYKESADRFNFEVSPDGSVSVTSLNATTFGSPSLATWYFVVAWHDATANTINIQVNNGTADSTAHSTGVDATATPDFMIGNYGTTLGPGDEQWDGLIDQVGVWKRLLTADERTFLYNSGNGRAYSELTGGTSAPIRVLRQWIRRSS